MILRAVLLTAGLLIGTGAFAQNIPPRVPEPEARTGQPTVGPTQTTDPRTTTGQGPVAVPGEGSPFGARGGAIPGTVNPDRVPPGTPGGQTTPP